MDPKTGKVELAAGKYTIYCTVPGHEAQGMMATLTVSMMSRARQTSASGALLFAVAMTVGVHRVRWRW